MKKKKKEKKFVSLIPTVCWKKSWHLEEEKERKKHGTRGEWKGPTLETEMWNLEDPAELIQSKYHGLFLGFVWGWKHVGLCMHMAKVGRSHPLTSSLLFPPSKHKNTCTCT